VRYAVIVEDAVSNHWTNAEDPPGHAAGLLRVAQRGTLTP
jgi:hypothetical protein